ncbi:unnamed protein product [marine sediment metagenome]|uniref:DUF4162 domain-containing protein n=1 Tax=marine sediment metagenome TaxID=412755 RepID=X1EED2_9ZZZZ
MLPYFIISSFRGILLPTFFSERFIPQFIRESKEDILSISARKPTLDDVFLSLTGRKIRDESANSIGRMRTRMKMRRGHR